MHSSESIGKAAADWIANYNDDAPFYTYISFLAPHDPRTMLEEFRSMYDPAVIALPPNFCGGHEFDTGALHIRDEMLAAFPRQQDETRQHIAEYYAMISHLDNELGKILKVVEDRGEMNNTIFVFSGDNGLALGQHGLFGKQNCYDHSVRVPLIFSGPGIPENCTNNTLCYLLDVFPTVCSLIGIDTPDSVEGVSLCQSMMGNEKNARESLYFAYGEFQRGVKKDGYKLIEYVIDGKHTQTQLFNLNDDKWELNNLAESDPDTVEKMRCLLKEFALKWDDTSSKWGKVFWEGYSAWY